MYPLSSQGSQSRGKREKQDYKRSGEQIEMLTFLGESRRGTFPGGSDGKVSAYNLGDLGSIPW